MFTHGIAQKSLVTTRTVFVMTRTLGMHLLKSYISVWTAGGDMSCEVIFLCGQLVVTCLVKLYFCVDSWW